MATAHEFDSRGSYDMGISAEVAFWCAMHSHRIQLTKAKDIKDKKDHYDFQDRSGNRYEVKSKKRIKRTGEPQDDFIWVELVNNAGLSGWLYGLATHFAFETSIGFLIVKAEKLRELVEKKLGDEIVQEPTKYKLYVQGGQPETRLTLIPIRDILWITERIIK